jgi:hypothetical protein
MCFKGSLKPCWTCCPTSLPFWSSAFAPLGAGFGALVAFGVLAGLEAVELDAVGLEASGFGVLDDCVGDAFEDSDFGVDSGFFSVLSAADLASNCPSNTRRSMCGTSADFDTDFNRSDSETFPVAAETAACNLFKRL